LLMSPLILQPLLMSPLILQPLLMSPLILQPPPRALQLRSWQVTTTLHPTGR
jgi:hypothetical protein